MQEMSFTHDKTINMDDTKQSIYFLSNIYLVQKYHEEKKNNSYNFNLFAIKCLFKPKSN